ncbi:MAG: hypothetical protein ACP5VS_05800 [Desulfomonilaceae bacterium]
MNQLKFILLIIIAICVAPKGAAAGQYVWQLHRTYEEEWPMAHQSQADSWTIFKSGAAKLFDPWRPNGQTKRRLKNTGSKRISRPYK